MDGKTIMGPHVACRLMIPIVLPSMILPFLSVPPHGASGTATSPNDKATEEQRLARG